MSFQEKNLQEYLAVYTNDRDSSSRKSDSNFDNLDIEQLRQRSAWQRSRGWLLHLGLIAVYTALFLISTKRGWKSTSAFGLLDSKKFPLQKHAHQGLAKVQHQQNLPGM